MSQQKYDDKEIDKSKWTEDEKRRWDELSQEQQEKMIQARMQELIEDTQMDRWAHLSVSEKEREQERLREKKGLKKKARETVWDSKLANSMKSATQGNENEKRPTQGNENEKRPTQGNANEKPPESRLGGAIVGMGTVTGIAAAVMGPSALLSAASTAMGTLGGIASAGLAAAAPIAAPLLGGLAVATGIGTGVATFGIVPAVVGAYVVGKAMQLNRTVELKNKLSMDEKELANEYEEFKAKRSSVKKALDWVGGKRHVYNTFLAELLAKKVKAKEGSEEATDPNARKNRDVAQVNPESTEAKKHTMSEEVARMGENIMKNFELPKKFFSEVQTRIQKVVQGRGGK